MARYSRGSVPLHHTGLASQVKQSISTAARTREVPSLSRMGPVATRLRAEG